MSFYNFSETSTVDYVIFETATTLKEALIREWNQLQESEIIELRQYLLQYTVQKPTLPTFVRERILQVNFFYLHIVKKYFTGNVMFLRNTMI